ncbi:hypothetical protein P9D39_24340 [Heyndrickxia oleronia]|uniref:Phage gp6-like head-tail connector protein n=1 Tax=Heyndrickxia oleronia TaxID=38875 RepID=A0A8E2IBK0_9BACI|nr:hypothetical protein [Heyndrickxia oleronia]MEC1377359.1 hypothetical protein [Heyndrickxia oleronia]OOP70172.1 hypothetical protein BWZ43_01105 [Heyndrickxia oleronia]QQZ05998.1 hypothetical protein I5818_05965 [Heyndrickxia oleronia]
MSMSITDEILIEFKGRMHLGDHEDDNLRRILSASVKALNKRCGNYDINNDADFKELVFERSRYVYNDALEFFSTNFLTEINNLAIDKALEEIKLEGETDATI